jgi:NADH oxidase (H2O2-forming)
LPLKEEIGMKKSDVLIVGGMSGIVVGTTARQYNKDAKITLVRKEKQVCVPCAIPYIFGTLGSTDRNIIPDAILSNNNIELVMDEVQSIDRDKKTVATSKGETIGFDKLILATGASPIVPPIPGINLDNVFVVKKDIDYLNALLKTLHKAKDVVIIGGGFIGVEFADEFNKRGLNVAIVELLPHCLQLVFDEEFCVRAEKKLSEIGVNVMTNSRAEKIVGDKKVEAVELSSGEKLKCDMVLLGIGVAPNTKLAKEAGLKIGEQRGIWVDPYMRTSDENIFAAGDCAEKTSFFTKKPSGLRLASIATWEARIAGANLFQLRKKQEGVIGVFSTIVRDLAIGGAGMTEKTAKDAEFDLFIGKATTADKHPGGMPGAAEMNVKLIFEKKTERILGGEISGGSTTAEAANILAAFIKARSKVDEIVTFQMGTHPMLTASPIAYPIVRAAEDAMAKK